MEPDFSRFATSDKDAAARAKRYLDEDPLKSIPRALLSSAEICDYARLTGMLHPFFPAALKSASYEAHIGGSFIRWDECGTKHENEIGRGDRCVLPANSITFVQIEPKFRLPNYIAVRFNLRITHVHRGLLLGTGPLVDPGFEGKLLVPLHNLTSSDYDLDTNEAVIWIEFTKTTHGVKPDEPIADLERHFAGFPAHKKNLSPEKYLRKANGGNPIRSSIPAAIGQSETAARSAAQSATNAQTIAEAIQRRVTIGGIVAVGAVVISLVALYFDVRSLIQDSMQLSTTVQQELTPLAADGKTTAERVLTTQNELHRLKEQVERINRELQAIQGGRSVPKPDDKQE